MKDIFEPICIHLKDCSSKGIKCKGCKHNKNYKRDYYEPYNHYNPFPVWPITPFTITPESKKYYEEPYIINCLKL